VEVLLLIIIGVIIFTVFYKLKNQPQETGIFKDGKLVLRDFPEKKYFRKRADSNSFQLRPSLLNSNEHSFFNQLKLALGEQYDIYPQVHLGAIFQPIKKWHNWAEISKLNKRIDFVLFDKSTQIPKIAIELDGYSHSKSKNFKRDEFVESIFNEFNIPLIRFNNDNYSIEEIRRELCNNLT